MVSDNIKQRMQSGSFIRKMFEEGNTLRKKYGEENVYDLSLGNPISEPPEAFTAELRKIVNSDQSGMHRYMENAGYFSTRSGVATQLSQETGLKFSENDIVMTCGAAGALNIVFKSLLNPGEEVIVFSPFFVEYENYVANHGGVLKLLPSNDNFVPDLAALGKAITRKTRAILLNSPNNPTGVVYDEQVIVDISDQLKRKEKQFSASIYLINDEPYRKLIYDGLAFTHIFKHYLHSISVTSHSKDLSIPGERIGYAALNPRCDSHDELMSAFIFCNRILGFVNAPALMQRVVEQIQNITVSMVEYQRKRDYLYLNLTDMGYSVVKPQGAFYIFPKCPIEDDQSFVRYLADQKVLTVPGSGFGRPGYFRMAYCVEDRVLQGAIAGLKKAIEHYARS
jgi:aspartate aminotransferase